MGSVMSAIRDDIDEYEDLCRKYGETPHYKPDAYGNLLLDCYGVHAYELKRRVTAEWVFKQPVAKTGGPSPVPKQVVWKNDIGQEINPGDRVITVATGYSHQIKVREGTFAGVSPTGSPQVRVLQKTWNSKKQVYEHVERKTTLGSGRVFKIA